MNGILIIRIEYNIINKSNIVSNTLSIFLYYYGNNFVDFECQFFKQWVIG